MKYLSSIVAAGLFFVTPIVQGQDYSIAMNGETIQLLDSSRAIHKKEIEPNTAGHLIKIVQFWDVPNSTVRAQWQQQGVTFLKYVPNNAYIIAISEGFDVTILERDHNVRFLSNVPKSLKIDRAIREGGIPQYARINDGRVSLIVEHYSLFSHQEVAQHLMSEGAQILSSNSTSHSFEISVIEAEISSLAENEFVFHLEPVSPSPSPINESGRALHRVNVMQGANASNRNYRGNGIIVGVGDGANFDDHVDFTGRVVNTLGLSINHATHVAGIIAGAGNINPRHKGMAPGASLLSGTGGTILFEGTLSRWYPLGLRVTNQSLAWECNAGYDFYSSVIDNTSKNYPGIVHVFGAGNDGDKDCGLGAGKGWGNLGGGYQEAKSTLTVGRVNNTDVLASTSSRGPTQDGRIKPDVCAKGTSVVSTVNESSYTSMGGTSMASPGVAGCVTTLVDAFQQINSVEFAPAVLIKGVVLNTADDLGNSGPDYKTGWGRVNTNRAIKVIEGNMFLSGTVDHSVVTYHDLYVPAGVKELRVMVIWDDVPATSGADIALVNDLDLTLINPLGSVYLPWSLSTDISSANALDAPATKGRDHRNTMEQVVVENPESGPFKINVNGFNVPMGPQEYHITYEFIYDSIEVTFPFGGESLSPGDNYYIRWDAHGNDGNFKIEYSQDGGVSWTVVTSSVGGDRRYYNWTVPAGVTSDGLIRVSNGGVMGEGSSPFSVISQPEGLNFVINCTGDTVQFRWNEVDGATYYEVFSLGNSFMESIGITSNTLFNLPDSLSVDDWVSVRAMGTGGLSGLRAIAVQIPTTIPDNTSYECQSFDCEGTAEFNIATVYSSEGIQVIYNGKLFVSTGYSTGKYPDALNAPWELMTFCTANPLDCSAIDDWDLNDVYSATGTQVKYDGQLFRNKWYTSGDQPGVADVWEFLGPCDVVLEYSVIDPNNSYRIYPMPANQVIRVTGGVNNQPESLALYAIDGVIIRECTSSKMNVENIPEGVFILSVDGVYYQQVIIEH